MAQPLPTVDQAHRLFATLLDHAGRAQQLTAELAALVHLCREHPSTPDGFGTMASGADRSATTSGGGKPELDEDGNPLPPVELTSVERAVDGRRQHRDPLERAALDGVRGAEVAIRGLQAIAAAIVAAQAARKPEEGAGEVGCWVMARIGVHEPMHRTSTLGGLLDVERPLGRWAYDFAREVGRLPTADECQTHAEGHAVVLDRRPPDTRRPWVHST